MSLITIETWSHVMVPTSDGEMSYETHLCTVKESVEEAYRFCKESRDYAGKEDTWHWRITAWKGNCCEPQDDQDSHLPDENWGGSVHINRDGYLCDAGGHRTGRCVWEPEYEGGKKVWTEDHRQTVENARDSLDTCLRLFRELRETPAAELAHDDFDRVEDEIEIARDQLSELP